MSQDNIKHLFTLFSGEEYTNDYQYLLNVSMSEVKEMLLPGVQEGDARLEFLCAALMNYRYRNAMASSDRSEYTYAGKMISGSDEKQLSFADRLLREYFNLCRELINTTDFVFMGV